MSDTPKLVCPMCKSARLGAQGEPGKPSTADCETCGWHGTMAEAEEMAAQLFGVPKPVDLSAANGEQPAEAAPADGLSAASLNIDRAEVEKLNLKPGDVLVVKIGEDPLREETVKALLAASEDVRGANTHATFMFLSKNDEAFRIPEAEMNRMGWFRKGVKGTKLEKGERRKYRMEKGLKVSKG